MDHFGNTDIGRKRKVNQDNFCVKVLAPNCLLCAVFDGMGGHAGGETASRIALERFSAVVCDTLSPKTNELTGLVDATKTQIFNVMNKGVDIANTAIFEAASENSELHGMGTTLAAVLINGTVAYGVNVGDSRVYLCQKDSISQISHDHSYVQYLIDIGEITKEEARSNSNKNIITKAVGTCESIEADTFVCSIDGGRLLLCSDGLSNHVDDTELFELINGADNAKECVDMLIDTANEHGGSDNITAIVVCTESANSVA